jgi:glycosyltransferase involved in cell wall biosynthesis
VPLKVLLVCDRRNWAYDAIAQALIKHNPYPELTLETAYLKDGPSALAAAVQTADQLFVLGWQLLQTRNRFGFVRCNPLFDHSRTITGIHSHHAWDNKKTQPDRMVLPPRNLVRFLRKLPGVNVVSKRLFDLFISAGLDQVAYTPNGVDVEIFRPVKPVCHDGGLVVGYSGSLKHDWRKGITEFIEPACKKAGVELRKAMLADGHYIAQTEMPMFYNEIDVYLCASSSEGFSLSVLEAAACGRPIVSTKVGGCEDLIQDGVNGFLVERDVDAMAEKLLLLKREPEKAKRMGAANREVVELQWSWESRAKDWIKFILSGPGMDGLMDR